MRYRVTYLSVVVSDDIPKLNGAWKKKIKTAIEAKLTSEPTLYGAPLRRNLSGCYKLRVGDYRVIYQVKRSTVLIITIQHRSVVYGHGLDTRI